MNRATPSALLLLLLGFAAPVLAEEAVLVLPVRATAFDQIEAGIRSEIDDNLALRILLASDYQGKPGGVVEAAIAMKPAVILPLGTGMSNMFKAAMENHTMPPLIAVAITNPSDVLPQAELDAPRSIGVTIIRDAPDSIYPCTAELIQKLVPATRSVGVCFTPGEKNSVSNLKQIEAQCERLGWTLVSRSISAPEDLEPTARSLVADGVSVCWLIKDRIQTSHAARFVEICHSAGVPCFASDAGTVESFRAVGTCSASFEDLGRYIGQVIKKVVIDGVDVRTIPVSTLEETEVFLSRPAVDQLGLEIPDAIARKAVFVGIGSVQQVDRRSNVSSWTLAALAIVVGAVAVGVVLRRRKAGDHDPVNG